MLTVENGRHDSDRSAGGFRSFSELWWCRNRTSCEPQCSSTAAPLTNSTIQTTGSGHATPEQKQAADVRVAVRKRWRQRAK